MVVGRRDHDRVLPLPARARAAGADRVPPEPRRNAAVASPRERRPRDREQGQRHDQHAGGLWHRDSFGVG